MERRTRIIEVKLTLVPPAGSKTHERTASLSIDGDGKMYASQVFKIACDLLDSLTKSISDTEVYQMINGEE